MNEWEAYTCCFTGHRILSREELLQVNRSLKACIRQRIEEGYCCFAAGGALGFDTIAARTVLELREEFPNIRLRLILPCKNQTRGWHPRDKETYRRILAQADQVEYVAENYLPGCYQARNRALVENSSCCICCLRNNAVASGTEFTVKLAEEKGIKIYHLLK